MNRQPFFVYAFVVVKILATAGSVYWVSRRYESESDGPLARLLRHRDRLWFASMLVIGCEVVSHLFFLNLLLRHDFRGEWAMIMVTGENLGMSLLSSLVFGLAGCLIVAPERKEAGINVWLASSVGIVLNLLTAGLSMAARGFFGSSVLNLPNVSALLLVGAYFICRAVRKDQPEPAQNEPATDPQRPPSAESIFLWLMVGFAPIPLCLVLLAPPGPSGPVSRVLLILCPICNLVGGIGCLGRIKNVGVRVILGIALAGVFFVLTALIAVFQACSHSGRI